jgi:hypothetical protein
VRRDLYAFRHRIWIVVLAVLAAACSSTAQNAAVPEAVDVPDPEAVAESPRAFDPPTDPSSRARTKSPSVARGPSSPTEVARDFVASVHAPNEAVLEASKVAQMGPGVTEDTITLGVPVVHDLAEALDALGVQDTAVVSPTEWKKAHRLVVRAINQTGGVLGRKLVPLFLDYRFGDYSSREERLDAMCRYFTEEHEVLAVEAEGLSSCMESAGGINFISAGRQLGLDTYAEYPHSLGPLAMSLDRIAANLVHALNAQDFFGAHDRVGLLSWDTPAYDRAIDLVLKPALEEIGVELAAEAQVAPAENEADYPRAIADGESVVVRFKQERINKLMLLGTYRGRNKFMELAEKHQYRPTYGLYTHTGSDGGLDDTLERQLWGSVGVGWVPVTDVPTQDGLAASPAARRCYALMDAGGLGHLYDHGDLAWYAAGICDFWLFFKAAIEAGGPAITADTVVDGAARMGDTFTPAHTFATRMGPARPDGVAAVRYFRYFRGCKCFQYTSPLYRAL